MVYMEKLCKSGAHLKVKNGLIHLQYGGLAEPQVKLRIKYQVNATLTACKL